MMVRTNTDDADDDAIRRDSERRRVRSQHGPTWDETGTQRRWSLYTDVEAERWRLEMER